MISPMCITISPTVHKVSPHGTHDIPHGTHSIHDIPHGTQDIPHIYNDTPHSTEHPTWYSRYPPTVLNTFHSTEHTLYRVIISETHRLFPYPKAIRDTDSLKLATEVRSLGIGTAFNSVSIESCASTQ